MQVGKPEGPGERLQQALPDGQQLMTSESLGRHGVRETLLYRLSPGCGGLSPASEAR